MTDLDSLFPDADNRLPDNLQEVNTGVYTLEDCRAEWGASQIDENEHVCVGSEEGGSDGDGTGSCSVSAH